MEKKYYKPNPEGETMIIKKYGYEYTLVCCTERPGSVLPIPCAFGKFGWALRSCRKLKDVEEKV